VSPGKHGTNIVLRQYRPRIGKMALGAGLLTSPKPTRAQRENHSPIFSTENVPISMLDYGYKW
jgi:hypothetical protein